MAPLDVSTDGLTDRAVDEVLTADAIVFVGELHDRFEARRAELLAARRIRDAPRDFLAETRDIREGEWQVPPPREDYNDRRVEITGPTDRKLVINALNSGARGFMADFEDANAPTWPNQIEGQLNLIDAIERTIQYDGSDGRHYKLGDRVATLVPRPRGLHLPERHAVDAAGEPVAGALVDFGLLAFHIAPRLVAQGKGAYLYLPKLEHHLEARWWDGVLAFAERALGLPAGTFRPTVLIETVPAAFQMHEMLWELRGRSYGLNAGRWDYIFSMIKCFADDPAFVMPDRTAVTMSVPFMHAYSELLVQTCHARGAFAMGGMAALIPSRSDPVANQQAIDAVKADKAREARAGFDGTWVAHPDVVDVATGEFDAILDERLNQIERRRPDVHVGTAELLDVAATPGAITDAGLRNDVSVGFQYISNWLSGRGAVGINNLMEDAATAEISRSQIWQWIRHGKVTREHVIAVLDEETSKIRERVGDEVWKAGHPDGTRAIFEQVALGDELLPFLTLPAYDRLS